MRKLLLVLVLASQAWGVSAFVRTTQTVAAGGSGTTVVSAAQAHATGNLLVVFIAWNDAANTSNVSTVVDTAGNTYTAGTRFFFTSTVSQMWYAKNIVGNAANVVTVTLSVTHTFRSLIVSEYSGLDTSAPLDVEATPKSVATNVNGSSNAFTTTNANDMLVMFVAAVPTFTAGSGYTIRNSATNYAGAEDQHVTSIQTAATGTMTASPATGWNVHLMAFKDAGGAAVPVRHRVISQ